ncbi:MAG: hypothetical protein JXR23_01385 [Pontiellaceae bacterium]|nr:hypothetical protein [Pontiellaceae bacterium]
METRRRITAFARNGHEQLNRAEKVRAVLWSAMAFGMIALLAELVFVLRGYRVLVPVLLFPLLVSIAVAVGCYVRFRYSYRRAVGHMDRFFNLKDGLVTADEHIREDRRGEIHELQLQHTERMIEPLDPIQIKPRFPCRLLAISLGLFMATFGLLFVDDSEAVKEQQIEEETVLALSDRVAEELEQVLEEMAEQEIPELRELVEDPSLRQLIEDFQGGNDRKAAMRKLSEIDRRLARMQKELDTRADENYLMELAEQLRQSRETAALGNALAKRDYREAAEMLEGMQLNEQSGAEQRAALEKMAAQIGETEKNMSQNESASRRNAQEMAQQIQKMAQQQQQASGKGEQRSEQSGEESGSEGQPSEQQGQKSSQNRNGVNESMQRSGNSMRQVAARREARSALNQLSQAVRQGQNQMSGQGQQPGEGQGQGQGQQPGEGQGQGQQSGEQPGGQPGGNAAGEGVDRSRRPPGESSPSDGTLEHLSGQLGEGESEKMVEDAASGTGVALGLGSGRGDVGYEQKLEDFVRREDVPEEMKHGVRSYFQQIHELETE